MEYVVICSVAFIASGLTFFSGFGLGTLLTPAFAYFFPIELAIALTAVVHFLNNLFKVVLVGKRADGSTVLRFCVSAIPAAFLGAWLLGRLSEVEPLSTYQWLGRTATVTPIKLVVAALMVLFALFDLVPRLGKLAFDKKYLPVGGAVTGFFGGLTGNQGALRSAFLLKSRLEKDAFIATGVVIACVVDVSRLVIYGTKLSVADLDTNRTLLLSATAAAFLGAYLGSQLVQKVTLRMIQVLVAVALFGTAAGLASGVL